MPRFTDDELHRLSKKHLAARPVVPGAPAWSVDSLQLNATWREQATLRRFAETPAYDDAAAQRALLPIYTDLPGMSPWTRSAIVWRSRAWGDSAPGAKAWHVRVWDAPCPDEDDEPAEQLGPFTSWAEAMAVARAEARYIVQRPARPTPATTARVAELRAAAFTDPADVQEVCS
ncbi:hypothetical protein [Micrococcus sp.]|uniref:hypothetical protein n=1 Tax=Micrococcus sp. TaxID=1271 RepID=UPI0026DBF55D|nr:hypothetical protein [Micrococcus sp.]MDO4240876.1 hypothetical protein [Micrococcus sp.]